MSGIDESQSREPGTAATLLRNLRAGLRIASLRSTADQDVVATWGQFGLLLVLSLVSTAGWGLAAVGWPAEFNWWGIPYAVFFLPLLMLTACTVAALGGRTDDTLALVVGVLCASLWMDAVVSVAQIAVLHLSPRGWGTWPTWLLFYAAMAWLIAVVVVAAARRFRLSWPKRVGATAVAIVLLAVPLVYTAQAHNLWSKPLDPDDKLARRLDYDGAGSEQVLYVQPRLLEHDLAALLPRREGRPNLYLIGVAGYGNQEVFRREVDTVDALFAERFGTKGRSLRLINSNSTLLTTPIATRTSLTQAIDRVGSLMNKEEDILFLFLTSHGSKDGRFSLALHPFRLSDLTSADLKAMLDQAGIRNRVIVVSSCYSGMFMDVLPDDDTLLITASARDRNSFGCGNESDFTYFGKAYFLEALRSTDSFSEAFDLALPLVAEREKKDDYKPSNPQRRVGARIEARLAAWRAGKDKAAEGKQ